MTMRAFGRAAALLCALTAAGCVTDGTLPTADRLAGTPPAPQPGADDFVAADLDGAVRHAQILRAQGKLREAARTLGQLILVAPDDARVLGEYGKTLAAEGRADDAQAFLKRAVQLQPNDWTLYSALGVAYDQTGDYGRAKLAYDRALAVRPGEPTVLNNAALSRMLAGDLDGAERLLAQAGPDQEGHPKIANNLALVRGLKGESPLTQLANSLGLAPTTAPSAAPTTPVAVAAAPAASPPETRTAHLNGVPVIMSRPLPDRAAPVPRAAAKDSSKPLTPPKRAPVPKASPGAQTHVAATEPVQDAATQRADVSFLRPALADTPPAAAPAIRTNAKPSAANPAKLRDADETVTH